MQAFNGRHARAVALEWNGGEQAAAQQLLRTARRNVD